VVKRNWMLVLLSGFGLFYGTSALAADGATLYQNYCAACHQANGEGIPGTYPFINGPIGRLSGFPEGREFLVATVLFGLKGEMMQRGYTYNGVMPGYAAAMSDEEVATLLNWLKRQWNNARFGAEAPDYTPDEVAKVRALKLTPEEVHAMLQKVEAIMHAVNGREGPGGHGGSGKGKGQGRGKGKRGPRAP